MVQEESLPQVQKGYALGRPLLVDLRDVWNAIQYIASTGRVWAFLVKDILPVSSVRYYFLVWRNNGLLAEIYRKLPALPREMEARN